VRTSDPDFEQSFSIFPNPVSGVLHLNYHFYDATTLSVRMLNLLGHIVYRSEIAQARSGTAEFDTAGIPVGTYMLELIDNQNRISVKKFVKER